jgi:hypothetical protein
MKIVRIALNTAASDSKSLDYLFDADNGYGQTPNSAEIQNRGFTLYLHPSEFLSLADDLPNKDLSFYEMLLDKDEPLGYPTLNIDMGKYGKKPAWRVEGHEGRHRVEAILKRFGDTYFIPVHMLTWPQKNRTLTDEYFLLPIIGQDKSKWKRKEFYMAKDRIDKNSVHGNFGVRKLSKKYPRHPAELANEVWQSDLNRKSSPCDLEKRNRNEDDVTEQVLLNEQPLHIYHNPNLSFRTSNKMRRVN